MSKNTTDKIIQKVWIDEDGYEITSFIQNPDYVEEKSWWQTIKDWFKSDDVEVYIGTRDLNNTQDSPGQNKPKTAIEVGIEVKF